MLCFFWATWHFSSLQLDRENCLRATGGNDGWNLHVKCLIVEMFSQYLSKMLIAITSLELKIPGPINGWFYTEIVKLQRFHISPEHHIASTEYLKWLPAIVWDQICLVNPRIMVSPHSSFLSFHHCIMSFPKPPIIKSSDGK